MAEGKRDVTVRLAVKNGAKFAKDNRKGADSVRGYGKAAKASAKEAKGLRSSMNSGLKSAAKYGAAFAGLGALKSSVDVTKDMATSMMALNRSLGSDAPKQAAEAYAAIFASRGIDTGKATMGFKKLSTMVIQAGKGSKTATATFKSLGISQKFLKENGNDLDAVTRKVSDAMGEMDNGARKTALGNSLFGRSWADLVKVVGNGTEAMDEEIAMLKKYGVISGKTTDDAAELAKAQRESKIATMGLQLMIGTQLLPVLLQTAQIFPKLVAKVKTGDGAFKTIRETINFVWNNVKTLTQWLSSSKDATNAMVYVLAALAVAWGVQKVIAFATAIKKLWLVTKLANIAMRAFRATMFLVNLVFFANPIGLIVLAIAALAAGFVTLYRKSETFRKIIGFVWTVLKNSPIGLTIRLIGKLVSAIGRIKAVRNAFNGIWDGLKTGFVNVLNWVIDKINGFIGTINKIPGVNIGKIGRVGDAAPSKNPNLKGRATQPGETVTLPSKGRARGGFIRGSSGTDRVNLRGTAGEFVIRKPAADRLGPAALNAMNNGQMPSGGGETPVIFRVGEREFAGVFASAAATTKARR